MAVENPTGATAMSILDTIYPKSASLDTRIRKLRKYTEERLLSASDIRLIRKLANKLQESDRFWMANCLLRLWQQHEETFKALLWSTRATAEGSPKSIMEAVLNGHKCSICGGSLTSTNACVECKRDRPDEWLAMHRGVALKKATETNLERYGASNVFASKSIRRRIRKSLVERYGVDSPAKNPEIRKKITETNRARYGGSSPAHSQEVRSRMQETCEKRFGVKNPGQSPEIREKMRSTNRSRRGVNNPMQSGDIKKRLQETNMLRFGGPSPFSSPEVQEKRRRTSLERYGTDHHMKNADVQRKHLKARYKIYSVRIGRKEFECQGTYELALLPKLVNRFGAANVHTQFSRKFPGTAREEVGFLPDFYISSKEKYVEMKSVYTLMDAAGMWDLNRKKARDAGDRVVWVVKHKTRFITLPDDWHTMTHKKLKDFICHS